MDVVTIQRTNKDKTTCITLPTRLLFNTLKDKYEKRRKADSGFSLFKSNYIGELNDKIDSPGEKILCAMRHEQSKVTGFFSNNLTSRTHRAMQEALGEIKPPEIVLKSIFDRMLTDDETDENNLAHSLLIADFVTQVQHAANLAKPGKTLGQDAYTLIMEEIAKKTFLLLSKENCNKIREKLDHIFNVLPNSSIDSFQECMITSVCAIVKFIATNEGCPADATPISSENANNLKERVMR